MSKEKSSTNSSKGSSTGKSGQKSGKASKNVSAASSASSSRAASPNSDDSDAGADRASRVMHRVNQVTPVADPTPRFQCTIVPTSGHKPGTPFKHGVLPDTGATITVIAYSLTQANGMTIRSSSNEKLLTADDKAMNVKGVTRFKINETSIRAIVSTSIKEDILLGWRDMQRLNIISSDFPTPQGRSYQTCAVSHQEDQEELIRRRDIIMEEFKDVFSDDLPTEPMKGPVMTIEFQENTKVKPKRVTTAREIPTHLQKDADIFINKLIKDKVIEPVPIEEDTEWISPAFFVPKEGGKAGVRLVTDFSHLNRAIKRPIHPFPSANDIARRIGPHAKYFAKLDAVQGYHQIPLSADCRKLTTFLLPSGKYQYCRGPMGLRSTNDWWCANSDGVIMGIANASKIVDDILITGDTIDELFKSLREVLHRCRVTKMVISKRKFKTSTEISFAGFHLSAERVRPDPGKVAAIRDFPTPTDVTGVRSFLGLANQLGHFIPDLATSTPNIRSLLKKNIAFILSLIHI